MRINFVEALVLWIIFLCCVASGAHSFINYAIPLSIQEQRAQMAPTLDTLSALGLAADRGRK